MVWQILVLIFFSLGGVLAVGQHGSELSLWFLAFGWVLDVTLLLLGLLGSTRVPSVGQNDGLAKWLRGLSLAAFLVAAVLRAIPNLLAFKIVTVSAAALWLAYFINFNRIRTKNRS